MERKSPSSKYDIIEFILCSTNLLNSTSESAGWVIILDANSSTFGKYFESECNVKYAASESEPLENPAPKYSIFSEISE